MEPKEKESNEYFCSNLIFKELVGANSMSLPNSFFSICFILLFVFCIPSNLIAQSGSKFTVKGKIEETSGFVVEYASVQLVNKKNVNQIFGNLSDEEGEFKILVEKGNYLLKIEAIGFELYEKEVVINQSKDLGTIVLQLDGVELNAAEIVADKPLYRVELDKKVYDLENDPASRGLSLTNALENVPSVQVDTDGTISLRGNENVRILIDGKPSSLVGISGTDVLANIPAENVKRVEVITAPSARYEASGSAGIINIVLKKGSNLGFNGSFGIDLAYPQLIGANANLNYKTKQWNFFGNFATRYAKRIGGSNFTNQFFDLDSTTIGTETNIFRGDSIRIETQTGDRIRRQSRFNIQLGADYSWDEKNNLLLSNSYSFSNANNERPLYYEDFEGLLNNPTLLETSTRTELEDEDDYNYQINASYKHKFNDDGHELTADSDFSLAGETELADISEVLLSSTTNSNLGLTNFDQTQNKETQTQFLLQADYVLPIQEKSRFEAGFRNNFRQIQNDFTVQQLNLQTNEFNLLEGFSDDTKYNENIFALYTQYGSKFGKFSYLAGLRLENSRIGVESKRNNNQIEKEYTDFFPTLNLNYEFSKKHEAQFSFSRRIRRPFSRWLIPFFTFSDDRNTFIGNQDLDPTYTNQFELTYIGTFGKLTITPALYYNFTDNRLLIHRVLRYFDEDDNIVGSIPDNANANNFREIFVAQPVNSGNEKRYGLDLNIQYKPTKWWRLSTNINYFAFEFNSTYFDPLREENFNYDGSDANFFLFVNNNFKLPKDINFQTTFSYRGKQVDNRNVREPIYALNFSLNKDLFNNNASLTFNVRDVLNSRRRNIQNFDLDYTSDINFYWSIRTYTLSFIYRIKQKKKRQRESGNRSGGDNLGY